jgi:hypothetical protein
VDEEMQGILAGDGHVGAIYNATGSEAYTCGEGCADLRDHRQAGWLRDGSSDALRAGMAKAGLPEAVINTWVSIQNDFAAEPSTS